MIKLLGKYGNGGQPLWHGLLFAILMFVSSTIESLLNAQYDYHIFTLLMRIRSCLISLIYRKILKLSPKEKKHFTTGEIVNIVSTDTQRVIEYVQIANLLWICPLQISFGIYLLWQHLQYGSFAGLLVIILLLPINMVIGAKMKKQQIYLLDEKDKRTKLMSEILCGIKVLKLYAWELPFVEKIKNFRTNEIKNLKKQAYLAADMIFAYNSAPFFVSNVKLVRNIKNDCI
jgi:ABC-type multidrug transport system fused ATPase/permease subunit